MSLRDIYTEVILDHYKKPRNKGEVDPHTHYAKGHNPLCGDKLELWIKVKDNVIEDIGFTGQGCAIHTASTSMLTEKVKGARLEDATRSINTFLSMLLGEAEMDIEEMGELVVLQGVKELHARIKCATLSWHTLQMALSGEDALKRKGAEGLEMTS